jgi:hypothetical protein
MNLDKEVDRNRLFRAMEWSYRQLEPWRNLVRGLVEEYAGSGYGADSAKVKHEILVNLMNQTVDAYTMSLVANRPRIIVTTKNDQLRPFAKQFEVATNNLIQEIELEFTLRQSVLNAFFCLGIIKVYMGNSAAVQLEEDLWMDPGTPYASSVSLDNWVHDMGVNQYSKIRYAGDWYRLPFSDLQNGAFDQSVVENLAPTSKHSYDSGDNRLDQISIGSDVDQDEVEPMIDLMDVWIPKERRIYTFPMEPARPFSGKFGPIAVMDWDGPEDGPYHLLSFNDVPENIMPTSPASHLSGLARLANSVLRKQSRQAKRQKDVYTYTPAGAEGAKKIQRTDDGQWVEVDDVKEIGVMKMGGVDSGNQAFFLSTVELYDRMAGNLKAMVGLGSQAATLGQEQLIHGAVSKKEAHMQYKVVEHTTSVIRDLGYLLWSDSAKVIPGKIQIPGAQGYAVDATWTPGDREGDFYDYQLGIDVYSMPYQSPAQRAQTLNTLIGQIYAPLSQLLMQQGGTLDIRKITEIYSELLNIPELKEIVRFDAMPPAMGQPGQPPQPGQGQPQRGQSGPSKPPATTRQYIRQNVPTGGTAQYRAQAEQQAWLDRDKVGSAGNVAAVR